MGRGGLSGAGDAIAQVRIRGNRRIESDAIRSRIKTRAGDPLNPARIARDVREVQSLGFFKDVNVYKENSTEGVLITFEVDENPVVREIIVVEGNDHLDTDKIDDVLTLTTGSSLDYPLLQENDESESPSDTSRRATTSRRSTTSVEPVGEGVPFPLSSRLPRTKNSNFARSPLLEIEPSPARS